MSKSEMDKLAEETAAEVAAEDETKPEAEAVEAGAGEVSREGLARVVGGVVAGVGSLVCRGYKVPDMEPSEVAAISRPLADLLDLYGLGPESEKGQAWLGLVGALMVAVGVRVVIYRDMRSRAQAAEKTAPRGDQVDGQELEPPAPPTTEPENADPAAGHPDYAGAPASAKDKPRSRKRKAAGDGQAKAA